MLLWNGFNAAYAGDLSRALDFSASAGNERQRFDTFFTALVEMDQGNRIYKAIWERFSQEIRLLLDNKYVFAPFWKHHAGEFGGAGWEISFDSAKAAANRALAERNTPVMLAWLDRRNLLSCMLAIL